MQSSTAALPQPLLEASPPRTPAQCSAQGARLVGAPGDLVAPGVADQAEERCLQQLYQQERP